MSGYLRHRPRKPTSILAHLGTPEQLSERYQRDLDGAAGLGSDAMSELAEKLPAIIRQPENLFVAAKHLERYGGQAPGPDNLRLCDLAGADAWQMLHVIAEQLRGECYCPVAPRLVKLPKPSGGTRTIELFNLADRIVSRGTMQVLAPWFETTFQPCSYGFRTAIGPLHALAAALACAERQQRFIWATADLQDAFGRVPVARLLELIQSSCGEGTRTFVEMLIGGRKRGIAQGAPLSSLLLNIYLNKFLDRPWLRVMANVPMFRYVDDLLLACLNDIDANRSLTRLESLLSPTGMKIKQDASRAIVDVGTTPAHWLGYQIARHGDEWVIDIRESAWEDLEVDLQVLQLETDSVLRCWQTVRGWINYCGPCYAPAKIDEMTGRLAQTARRCGFRELPRRKLREWWRRAWYRWNAIATSAGSKIQELRSAPEIDAPSFFMGRKNG